MKNIVFDDYMEIGRHKCKPPHFISLQGQTFISGGGLSSLKNERCSVIYDAEKDVIVVDFTTKEPKFYVQDSTGRINVTRVWDNCLDKFKGKKITLRTKKGDLYV